MGKARYFTHGSDQLKITCEEVAIIRTDLGEVVRVPIGSAVSENILELIGSGRIRKATAEDYVKALWKVPIDKAAPDLI